MDLSEAADYCARYLDRRRALRKKLKSTLIIIDCGLLAKGSEPVFRGKMNRPELVEEILRIEFPRLAEANQARREQLGVMSPEEKEHTT